MHCFCQKHWYSVSNYINFLFVFFLRDLDSSGYVGKMDGYKEKQTSIFTQRFLQIFWEAGPQCGGGGGSGAAERASPPCGGRSRAVAQCRLPPRGSQ